MRSFHVAPCFCEKVTRTIENLSKSNEIFDQLRIKVTGNAMLVSISIENFRSFSTEQTFSMVASERLAGSHADHTIPIPNSSEKVLRAAVIYGANGAGKSNLFKALRYIEKIALRANRKDEGTKRERYLFSDDKEKPSSFDPS